VFSQGTDIVKGFLSRATMSAYFPVSREPILSSIRRIFALLMVAHRRISMLEKLRAAIFVFSVVAAEIIERHSRVNAAADPNPRLIHFFKLA